jgi:two-component system, NarL family, response regulator NreC
MSQRKKIVIAEDHEILREGLKALLNASDDLVVVGEAKDGLEAIRCIRKLEPDVVLLDLSMPRLGGLSVIKEITGLMPDLKIIVLTMHNDEDFAIDALNSGAMGFCLKSSGYDELMKAIHSVLNGKIFASAEILEKVLQGFLESRKKVKKQSSWYELTQREKEVLKLVGEGYRNKEIADLLHISIKTVEKHRANVMQKLDLHTASSLTAYAIRKGLVVK